MSVAGALDSRPEHGCVPSREAPGPRGWRLFRDLLQMRRNRIELVTRAMHEHGDIVRFRTGRRRLFLAAHPDAVRRVLVDNPQNYHKGLGLSNARPLLGDGLLTSEGELWASRRKSLHAALQTQDLEAFASSVVEAAEQTAADWSARGDSGIDLGRDMLRLTLRAFTRGILRVDVSTREEELLDDFEAIEAWAMARSVSLLEISLAVPSHANVTARRAIARLENVASTILDAPPRPGREGSLLAGIRMLDAANNRIDAAGRDELLTLLLAGHETTGAALAWTWFCLGNHPDAEARLHAEVTAVIDDRAPALADVGRLPYTRAVFEEACRLYPPVWLIPRRACAADDICGFPVAAGDDVLLVVYSLQRHPSLWDAPDDFNPDRFLSGRAALRGTGVYLPFGAGPRACLGSRLATLESVLVLAVLARRFRVRCDAILPSTLNPRLTLHFPKAHPARATPRHVSKPGEAPRPSGL